MEYQKTAGAISRTQLRQQRYRHRGVPRRLFDCGSDDNDNNNNNNVSKTNIVNNTTTLVDELDQLRTDNFQLRLRVYNAERRVDRLSATAAEQFRHGRKRCDEYSTDESSDNSDTSSTDNDSINDAVAAKATAEAAVRTIHDLLTVNRRLLALLAATVSAKAVAVTAADKRRWRRLQNHIHDLSDEQDEDEEKRLWQKNDDKSNVSKTDFETYAARVLGASTKSATTLTPPPLPPATVHEQPVAVDHDSGAGSELARLRARCQRLERSLQQLVNTELWARNRQIGKLEQQRFVSLQQLADVKAKHNDRRTAVAHQSRTNASPTTTKGILVIRSPTSLVVEVQQCPKPAEAQAVTITTPPPVLPDYSEVNFFFSCDEEDDNQENNCMESNGTKSESSADDNDDETEPVHLLQSNSTMVAVHPQKRQCGRHRQQSSIQSLACQGTGYVEMDTTWSSSSTESLAIGTGDSSVVGVTSTTSPTLKQSRRRRRSANGRGLRRPRRRRCIQHRCLACGCFTVGGDAVEPVKNPSSTDYKTTIVADAQVQCNDDDLEKKNNNINNVDEDQLLLLRRELDARRRENCRLYDMLLKLQCDRGPIKSFNDCDDDPNSNNWPDQTGSPESYRRAACAVRGRIADLLPPLLSVQSTSVGSPLVAVKSEADHIPGSSQNNGLDEQQQQQLLLLSRLRERIVAYERHELQFDGHGDNCIDSVLTADSDNAVHHMNRADLINVALPQTVDRLRRVLMPLIQQQQQRVPEEEQTIVDKERKPLNG